MAFKAYKTYVITLSKTFPTTHPKAGQPTNFAENLGKTKLHTIRGNYELWEKRFKQIESGEACLSIRQWTGKPYASKQVEIANLTKEDGIGLQKLTFDAASMKYPRVGFRVFKEKSIIANNDGLSSTDWVNWFKKADLSKPMAIIHFTKFRY